VGGRVSQSSFVRQPLPRVVAGYNRMARWYRLGEPAILLPPGMRRKAVRRLGLKPGDTVLEVGCGTGRNLALLADAVGAGGVVIGVDATPGMLAQAQRLVERRGWPNVRLQNRDAKELELDRPADAVLFSYSYSVLPEREPVLDKAWEALRPGGRLVVVDAGLPANRVGRLLTPIGEALAKVFPGDPYSRPWDDLARLARPVETERFLLDIHFICAISKT
jgi:demethylmenaquinone methyltransferase/2-methoxy-6-polyprenyl-1,4-benzoquinol methylase